ncbi:type VII secretion system-associated protein [Streptomyces sp. OM5714]|uniref:type VII secretion system-associated protein n=1 Tax=Streptomyces sp. OM5714 TaxID=2602736 RepID=UPI0013DCE2E8|nr:type VII secretion system-associated protein [Streptomyces sp. OM5714]KAF2775045.1 hypothetical protein STPH1_7232 [Streptomyces sp. OM5714]
MDEKDPNPKTGKLVMDKAGLESFLKDRVEHFRSELDKITKDDPEFGPSMARLIGEADRDASKDSQSYDLVRPLAIGLMADKGIMDGVGAELNDSVGKTAKQLADLYEQQIKLFDDIKENLETTIAKLLAKQNQNLQAIDGQEFLDLLEDVERDLGGTKGGGGEKEE